MVEEAQANLDKAKPLKTVRTSQLQLNVEKLEREVKGLRSVIKRKSDQYDAIHAQIVGHCDQIRQKELEVVALNEQIAKAIVVAPPTPPQPPPS